MNLGSPATSTINTGMFTVNMRVRRKAGKLASAYGRLPIEGASTRRERAAHAGEGRRSYFGGLGTQGAIGPAGHSEGFARHTEAGRGAHGSLRGGRCQTWPASGQHFQSRSTDRRQRSCWLRNDSVASALPCETVYISFHGRQR